MEKINKFNRVLDNNICFSNTEDNKYSTFTTTMVDTSIVERWGRKLKISEEALKNYSVKNKDKKIKLFKDHNVDVDNIIGYASNITYNNDNKSLICDCYILNNDKNEMLKNNIKDRLIDAVSIGFSVKNETYDKTKNLNLIDDINIHELSIVSFPAIENAVINEVNFQQQEIIKEKDMSDEKISQLNSAIELQSKTIDKVKEEFSSQIKEVKKVVENKVEEFSKSMVEFSVSNQPSRPISNEEIEEFNNYLYKEAIKITKGKGQEGRQDLDKIVNDNLHKLLENAPKKFKDVTNEVIRFGNLSTDDLNRSITTHDVNAHLSKLTTKEIDITSEMQSDVEDMTARKILSTVDKKTDNKMTKMTSYIYHDLTAVARPRGEQEKNDTFRGSMNEKRITVAKQGIQFSYSLESVTFAVAKVTEYAKQARLSFMRGIVQQLMTITEKPVDGQIESIFGYPTNQDNLKSNKMIDITIPQKDKLSVQKLGELLIETNLETYDKNYNYLFMVDKKTFSKIQKDSIEQAKADGDITFTNQWRVDYEKIDNPVLGTIKYGGFTFMVTDNIWVSEDNPEVNNSSPYKILTVSQPAMPRSDNLDTFPTGKPFMLAFKGGKNRQYKLQEGGIRSYVTIDNTTDGTVQLDFFQFMAGSNVRPEHVIRFFNPTTSSIINLDNKSNKPKSNKSNKSEEVSNYEEVSNSDNK